LLTDPYQILNISSDASEQQVKDAYRQLAKKYHPDVSKEVNASEKFIAITEAYETIQDGTSQFQPLYDTFNSQTASPGPAPPVVDPQERARQYAQAKYEEFVRNNEEFKHKWYYFPTKVFSYAFLYMMFLMGLAMLIIPIGIGIYTSFEDGFIVPLFLFMFGFIWINTTRKFMKEIEKFFKEY
jgi:hypothetical protein